VGYNHGQAEVVFFEEVLYVILRDDKCRNFASLVISVVSFKAVPSNAEEIFCDLCPVELLCRNSVIFSQWLHELGFLSTSVQENGC
jgi:hypothetical protein